jgi:hypothetical protein
MGIHGVGGIIHVYICLYICYKYLNIFILIMVRVIQGVGGIYSCMRMYICWKYWNTKILFIEISLVIVRGIYGVGGMYLCFCLFIYYDLCQYIYICVNAYGLF